ncbi:3-deoxy-D-manno-octulosonate 8-phosphate phosphatase [Candidatus Dependentiae bacterium]|nr:3-deoxy-D-manno-octulosonate 8-phosphate phosphatase [Candidatus Dependentiae bacterium]
MLKQLEWFKTILNNKKLVTHLKEIKLIVADVDGSLTDGTVHYNDHGEADRAYSPQDGFAMRMAMEQGIQVAVLSGNAGASITSRAKKLKVADELTILGSLDKTSAIASLQQKTNILPEHTLLFGDDYLDAEVKIKMPKIFFAMPNNGIFYLQPLADCVTPLNAGPESALRLLLDLILYIQGKHFAQDLITSVLAKG